MAHDKSQTSGSLFTVYDPFAEALYCRRTFEAATQAADKIGCSLIVELQGDDPLDPKAVRSRYRKIEGDWVTEAELEDAARHILEQSKKAFRLSEDAPSDPALVAQLQALKDTTDALNLSLLPPSPDKS